MSDPKRQGRVPEWARRAWAELANYLDGRFDLSDKQCAAIIAHHAPSVAPAGDLRERALSFLSTWEAPAKPRDEQTASLIALLRSVAAEAEARGRDLAIAEMKLHVSDPELEGKGWAKAVYDFGTAWQGRVNEDIRKELEQERQGGRKLAEAIDKLPWTCRCFQRDRTGPCGRCAALARYRGEETDDAD